MPEPTCSYALVAVEDRGERKDQQVPGMSSAISTYRFDVRVDEACLEKPSAREDLGVIAIAEMGYWEPYYFAD